MSGNSSQSDLSESAVVGACRCCLIHGCRRYTEDQRLKEVHDQVGKLVAKHSDGCWWVAFAVLGKRIPFAVGSKISPTSLRLPTVFAMMRAMRKSIAAYKFVDGFPFKLADSLFPLKRELNRVLKKR